MIKTRLQTAYYLLVLLFCLTFAILALPALNFPGGIKAFTIKSGSMAPAITTGSIIVIKPFKNYHVGDVVLFYPPKKDKDLKKTITHRIYKVVTDQRGILYVTKGDASSLVDPSPVSPDLILGKVVVLIPKLGNLIDFVKAKKGLRILIVFLAVGIIFIEAFKIRKEIVCTFF